MKRTLIAGAVAALLALPPGAQVPEGTQLLPDAQQVFVRNIGTEPASIDPQMVEESAGSDVVNDLFEGSTPWMATASCWRPAPLATNSTPRAPSTPSSSDPGCQMVQRRAGDGGRLRLWLAAGGGSQERLQLRLVHRADRRHQRQRGGAGQGQTRCPGDQGARMITPCRSP